MYSSENSSGAVSGKRVPLLKKAISEGNLKAFSLAFVSGLARIGDVHIAGYAAALAFEKNKLAAVLGSFLSCTVSGTLSPSTAAANVFVFLAHKICTGRLKSVSVTVRFVTALMTSAILIAGILTDGGGNIMHRSALAATIPIFLLVFLGFSKKNAICRAHYEIAILATSYIAVCIFPEKRFGDIDFRLIAAATAVLIASKRAGYVYGGITGTVTGLACGLNAVPAVSIGGLFCGFIYSAGENVASALFYMSAVAILGLFSGASAVLPAAINIGISVIVFILIRSKIVLKCENAYDDGSENAVAAKIDKRAETPLSMAFSSLSSTLMAVSDTREQILKDSLYCEISKCVDSSCSKCVGCRTDVADMKLHFLSLIESGAVPSRATVKAHFYIHCRNVDEITEKLRAINAETVCPEISRLRSLAADYVTISKILENDEQRSYSDNSENISLTRNVAALYRSVGLFADNIRVTGTRKLTLQIFDSQRVSTFPNTLVPALEAVCGTRLSEPQIKNTASGSIVELHTVPSVTAEHSHITTAKKGENICGDTVAFFESKDMRFYAVICDGMGSGREAALASRLGAVFLEKMLTAGADKAHAVAMLNKALSCAGDEVFTTVDLVEIDKVTSDASILKSGAAPTYIIRNGNIRKIESHTPPAGIIEDVCAEQTQIKLQAGDRIIMASDGISDISEASIDTELSVSELSAVIAETSSKRANDDMSIIALEITALPR